MINSQKRKIGTSFLQARAKILIIILAIILLLVILNLCSKSVKNFFYVISSPFQKFFWRIGNNASDFLYAFLRIKDLKNDNNQLLLENQKLLLEISVLEDLKKENQTLREALDIGLQKDFKMVLAQVISKDISEDSILIDKGSDDGLSKDMPVINQQKIIFGKVAEVYKNFSRVILITEKSSAFDAKIQFTLPKPAGEGGEKEIYGVVKGKGNLDLYFDIVSKNAEIKEGDVLTTSTLGGEFPQNLLVGQIEKIKKEDIKPFQSADIKPFFNLEKTESLFVITNFNK